MSETVSKQVERDQQRLYDDGDDDLCKQQKLELLPTYITKNGLYCHQI